MVDVSGKPMTHRIAIAAGRIEMRRETFERIESGVTQKGDVLGIARIAGIQAAKKTSDLIPLCHPLMLTRITVDFEPYHTPEAGRMGVTCQVRVETQGITGVEMEALTAVQVSLLTIFDMCKAIDRGMRINDVHVVQKIGGKSDLHSY